MKQLNTLRGGGIALLIGALVLVHGIVLERFFLHVTWTIATLLLVAVFLKHLGVLGPIYAFFKRRSRG